MFEDYDNESETCSNITSQHEGASMDVHLPHFALNTKNVNVKIPPN